MAARKNPVLMWWVRPRCPRRALPRVVFPTPGTPARRIMRDLVGLEGSRRADGVVEVEGFWASMLVTGTSGTLLTFPRIAVCEFRQDVRACQRNTFRVKGEFRLWEGHETGKKRSHWQLDSSIGELYWERRSRLRTLPMGFLGISEAKMMDSGRLKLARSLLQCWIRASEEGWGPGLGTTIARTRSPH